MFERKCFTEKEVRGEDAYVLSNDFIILYSTNIY